MTYISFLHMTIEAKETDLSPAAVPEYEIWNIEGLWDYRIRLINDGGKAMIVDFEEWKVRKDVADLAIESPF